MKKAVIYARYSSDMQRKESIDEQVRACKYYAQQSGQYEITGIYSDEAVSGRHTKHRAGFNQLMQDARQHKFDAVIVWELSRFSRSGKDTIVYVDELRSLGIELLSVRENLENSPEGHLMLIIISGMNQFYSENLAIETMRGQRENALDCKIATGRPPFGYTLDSDKHYVVNEVEAEAVRRIFRSVLAKTPYSRIADELDTDGYRTSRGGKFTRNAIRTVVTNPRYTGIYIWGETTSAKDGTTRRKRNPESEVIRIEGGMPAIVSKEEFDEVQKLLKSRAKGKAPNRSKHTYLLSTKVYCAHCGSTMWGKHRISHGNDFYYYKCDKHRLHECDNTGINADVLEEEVLKQMSEKFFTPENIDKLADKIYADTLRESELDTRAKSLHLQSAELERRIANGTKAILGGFNSKALQKAVEDCEAQLKAVNAEIVRLDAAADNAGRTRDEIKAFIKEYSDFSKLSPESRWKIIDKFLYRVYVRQLDVKAKQYDIQIIIAPTEEAREYLDELTRDWVNTVTETMLKSVFRYAGNTSIYAALLNKDSNCYVFIIPLKLNIRS